MIKTLAFHEARVFLIPVSSFPDSIFMDRFAERSIPRHLPPP